MVPNSPNKTKTTAAMVATPLSPTGLPCSTTYVRMYNYVFTPAWKIGCILQHSKRIKEGEIKSGYASRICPIILSQISVADGLNHAASKKAERWSEKTRILIFLQYFPTLIKHNSSRAKRMSMDGDIMRVEKPSLAAVICKKRKNVNHF